MQSSPKSTLEHLFHHPQKNPHTRQWWFSISPPIHPYLQPKATTNLLPISIHLLVPDFLYKQNHTIGRLCDWLLSFSIMFSKFIHFIAWICGSFFFIQNDSPLYGYSAFYLFIHSSVGRWLLPFNMLIIPPLGTSLVVQWLRFHIPNASSPGLIPGQGTRSHIQKLGVHMPQLKIPKLRPGAVKWINKQQQQKPLLWVLH